MQYLFNTRGNRLYIYLPLWLPIGIYYKYTFPLRQTKLITKVKTRLLKSQDYHITILFPVNCIDLFTLANLHVLDSIFSMRFWLQHIITRGLGKR